MNAPARPTAFDQVVSPALGEVLRERWRAIHEFGHDANADDALPLQQLGERARDFLQIAADRAAGPPDRRVLQAARKKAIQAAALNFAFLDAIDREIAREKQEAKQ